MFTLSAMHPFPGSIPLWVPRIASMIGLRGGLFLGIACTWIPTVCGQEIAPHIDQHHPIFAAARSGNVAAVVQHLDQGISINAASEYGQTPLRAALEARKPAVARELLRRGFKPTLVFRSANTKEFIEIGRGALSQAARINEEEIVDALLAGGLGTYPSKYAADPFDADPVLSAIQADATGILRKLLAHAGQEALATALRRNSHAYLAACRSAAAIEALNRYGVDLDASDSVGPFPHVLHVYAQRGWSEGVAKLLALGADPTTGDQNQRLPEDLAVAGDLKRALQLAAMRVHVERAQGPRGPGMAKAAFPVAILEAAFAKSENVALAQLAGNPLANINALDDRGWSALTYACEYNFTRLAAALVERGADVALITEMGSSMMAFAASTGDTALVRKMAAKGAAVDAAEKGKGTALIMAVQAKNMAMVETLLELGAQVDPPRPGDSRISWSSALMVAAKTGDIALMEKMVKAGGDLHAVDSSGESVVFWAVRSGNVAALHWLLDRGAYLHLKTPRGTNAATLAASLGQLDMLKELVRLGLTHSRLREYSRQSNHPETQAYAQSLEKEADPNDPAHLWTRHEISTDEVRRYLAAGGDPNYAKETPTPLQAMAWQGNVDAIRLLLEKGADPAKRGRLHNSTPFLALQNAKSETAALEILKLLLARGISPNRREFVYGMGPQKEPTGSPLLSASIQQGYLKCAHYLLEKGADPLLEDHFLGGDAFEALRRSTKLTESERNAFRQEMEKYRRPSSTAPPTRASRSLI